MLWLLTDTDDVRIVDLNEFFYIRDLASWAGLYLETKRVQARKKAPVATAHRLLDTSN